jgi:hypothetical protein
LRERQEVHRALVHARKRAIVHARGILQGRGVRLATTFATQHCLRTCARWSNRCLARFRRSSRS